MKAIVLASSSVYRRAILDKTGLTYQSISPDINENRQIGEHARDLVARLSLEKAKKIAQQRPNSLIIGSDQVAVLAQDVLCKPLTEAKAIQQLTLCAGNKVTFLTGLCLYDSNEQSYQLEVVPFSVHFRPLTAHEIRRYIALEKPLDCAGSFKVEGLGISLFEKLSGDDFNSLIGLPLICLLGMLREKGISPLS